MHCWYFWDICRCLRGILCWLEHLQSIEVLIWWKHSWSFDVHWTIEIPYLLNRESFIYKWSDVDLMVQKQHELRAAYKKRCVSPKFCTSIVIWTTKLFIWCWLDGTKLQKRCVSPKFCTSIVIWTTKLLIWWRHKIYILIWLWLKVKL